MVGLKDRQALLLDGAKSRAELVRATSMVTAMWFGAEHVPLLRTTIESCGEEMAHAGKSDEREVGLSLCRTGRIHLADDCDVPSGSHLCALRGRVFWLLDQETTCIITRVERGYGCARIWRGEVGHFEDSTSTSQDGKLEP